MIILDNVVVTDEFLNAQFCCCLPRCKGWCCVAGDAGAPLEASEIEQIEDNLEAIKPYMRPEGIKVIEDNDVYDYDETGELVTPLVNGEECAFVYFHENGTALCAIEKAYLEGKCDFWKPISCHLYPIRLVEKDGFTHRRKMASHIFSTTNGASACPLNARESTRAFHCGSSSKGRWYGSSAKIGIIGWRS